MKRHLRSFINRFVSLFLLTVLASHSAQAYQYDMIAYGILQLAEDDNLCAVVKVHSIVNDSKGKPHHQSGMGWIVVDVRRNIGVLTPFHVIAEASHVYGECNGRLFDLNLKKFSAEKDLALLHTNENEYEEIRKFIFPVIFQDLPGSKSFVDGFPEKSKALFSVVSPPIPMSEYQNNLKGLALSATSYGIASAPDLSDRSKSVIISPDLDLSVESIVEDSDPLAKYLVRIDGLGIRPGLSGSVLFGIIGTDYRLNAIRHEEGQIKQNYALSVQWMPKIILGMVTKTRLNGSETVAISTADIMEFMSLPQLEQYPVKLNVSFQKHETASGLELIPVMSLGDSSFTEYCGDNYKNSGNLSPLTLKTPEEAPKKLFFFKKPEPQIPIENKIYEKLLKDTEKIDFNKFKVLPKKKIEFQIERGGGDYGEGGNGFSSTNAEFHLSKLKAFKLEDTQDHFKNIKQFQSQGIYKVAKSCKQEGLIFDNKLISQVLIPGKESARLATFEDLRAFYKKYGYQSLKWIQQYATNQITWPYADHTDLAQPLRIPLVPSTDGGFRYDQEEFKDTSYFQQKMITTAKQQLNHPSYYQLSHQGLEFQFQSKTWNLSLKNQDLKWSGVINFSHSCQVNLKPEYFRNINSWKAAYEDPNISLTLTLGSMDELLRINITRLSSCPENQKLLLGQFVIYGNAGLAPVIGSKRTAIVPSKYDIDFLIKRFHPERKEP